MHREHVSGDGRKTNMLCLAVGKSVLIAGETPIIAVAPAIANAIYDAIGVRMRDLPITPEKILTALEAQGRE